MKPDTLVQVDAIERAHLRDPQDRSHVMFRYPPPDGLAELVRRYWIPVWTVEPGREVEQQVLQYPCALVVIAHDYARFYGVTAGLSRTTLRGTGWAVGVLCQPAAGALLTGRSMVEYRNRSVDLSEVLGDRAAPVVASVRAAMGSDAADESAHRAATSVLDDAFRAVGPIDEDGWLVNRIVDAVETDEDLVTVGRLADRFGIGERALQRLVRRRVGLSPKWLIQRRRLHRASERLRGGDGPVDLAAVAAELGYADQSHFTRDFRSVTGRTPGEFARHHRNTGASGSSRSTEPAG